MSSDTYRAVVDVVEHESYQRGLRVPLLCARGGWKTSGDSCSKSRQTPARPFPARALPAAPRSALRRHPACFQSCHRRLERNKTRERLRDAPNEVVCGCGCLPDTSPSTATAPSNYVTLPMHWHTISLSFLHPCTARATPPPPQP